MTTTATVFGAGRATRSEQFPRTSRRHRCGSVGATSDVPGHRAEVDVLEVRLFGFEARRRCGVAIHAHERASPEELTRDHRMFVLDSAELLLGDHASPDFSAQIRNGSQWLSFEEDLTLIDDGHARAHLAH